MSSLSLVKLIIHWILYLYSIRLNFWEKFVLMGIGCVIFIIWHHVIFCVENLIQVRYTIFGFKANAMINKSQAWVGRRKWNCINYFWACVLFLYMKLMFNSTRIQTVKLLWITILVYSNLNDPLMITKVLPIVLLKPPIYNDHYINSNIYLQSTIHRKKQRL